MNIHRKKYYIKNLSKYKMHYLLLLPAIIFFVVFKYLPVYGVIIAFKDFRIIDGIIGSEWAGLSHFNRMFDSESFMRAFTNTIKISLLQIAISFPAPIILALMLNELKNIRFKKVSQTISYLPHFLSWIIVGALMKELMRTQGIINSIITMLGGTPRVLLTEEKLFVPILIISNVWKNIGWGSIIYLASISGIDPQLYEAAEIDGCSKIKKIRYITIPSLIPVISILFLLRVGRVLNAGFDQIFNLYSPMVYQTGDILDTFVYRTGLVSMEYSYSAAAGLFKNVIGLILMLIVNFSINRKQDLGII